MRRVCRSFHDHERDACTCAGSEQCTCLALPRTDVHFHIAVAQDEKLQLVFALYDSDDDGTMSIVELARLIKHGREELKAMIEFSEEVMLSLDRNGDNLITRFAACTIVLLCVCDFFTTY